MKASQVIYEHFKYIRNWTIHSLQQFTPGQAVKKPNKKFNTILWIAGHLLWTEEMLIAQPLGLKRNFEGIKLNDFAMGSKPENVKGYKSKYNAIITYLAGSSDELGERILQTKESDWDKKWKGVYAKWFPTKLSAIKHCILHEGTHVGQIWVIEKFLL
jgi:hypothetical protein